MRAAEIPTPTADELEAAFADSINDWDLTHLVRPCDPDTALCGEYVPGDCFVDDGSADDGPVCPECTAIERTNDAVHIAGCVQCQDAG